MTGLSEKEIKPLQSGEIQVFGMKMAVLRPELAERGRIMANFRESDLDGATFVDATFIAKNQQSLLDVLKKDRPPSVDWNTIRRLSAVEAVDVFEQQRDEIADQIRAAISRITRGESSCERIFGIGM